MKPLISIILPVYNSEKYLAQAIESILSQSFTNFEFIIINDASTDQSRSIIGFYRDSRIRIVDNIKNRGNYACRNAGLKLARGAFIAVMDADDIAEPDRFKIQYRFLKKNDGIGLVGSHCRVIDKHGNETGYYTKAVHHAQIKTMLLRDNHFVHPSVLMRNDFIKKHYLRYNEAYTYAADYDFMVKCSHRFSIANIDEPLIRYRVHEDQITEAKKQQQTHFADLIRLKQLALFKIKTSTTEKQLHLKIMKACHLDDTQSLAAFNWCERLLRQNTKQRLFHHTTLYNLLQLLLEKCFSARTP
ncbi:MAG: glycosyltransferase [Niabella sp.]